MHVIDLSSRRFLPVLPPPVTPVYDFTSVDTPDVAESVAVEGDVVYVADNGGGLRVIRSVPEPTVLLSALASLCALAAVRGRTRRSARA